MHESVLKRCPNRVLSIEDILKRLIIDLTLNPFPEGKGLCRDNITVDFGNLNNILFPECGFQPALNKQSRIICCNSNIIIMTKLRTDPHALRAQGRVRTPIFEINI